MSCYHPLKGFRSVEKGPTGKPIITFNPLKAINSHLPIMLPCGNCIGCRLDRARDWANRCMHESEMHEHNSFITLTYSDDHLPDDYSVDVREIQLFMKRLRFELYPIKVRFFAVGEYGDQTQRPHYHALIFGYDFPDRVIYARTKDGIRYTSEQLDKIWGLGRTEVGTLTIKSANYCARYTMKKMGGDLADRHYLRTHPKTGLVVKVQPEFCVQSRRPGLGSRWFDKYKSDCFPSDFLVVEGRQTAVPKYYVRKLTEEHINKVKLKRKIASSKTKVKENRTKDRLAVREEIHQDRLSRLKRPLED